jgi:periplasmic mercuric ion binding protein
MNKMRFNALIAVALMALAAAVTGCSGGANAKTDFWVRANCEMCEETIEGALKGTKGVVKADLDLEANTVHVEFDSTVVKEKGLHEAVANAGYDTKLVTASVAAYDALPKCCKKVEDM